MNSGAGQLPPAAAALERDALRLANCPRQHSDIVRLRKSSGGDFPTEFPTDRRRFEFGRCPGHLTYCDGRFRGVSTLLPSHCAPAVAIKMLAITGMRCGFGRRWPGRESGAARPSTSRATALAPIAAATDRARPDDPLVVGRLRSTMALAVVRSRSPVQAWRRCHVARRGEISRP